MNTDNLNPEHLAAIETACENALADQRSPGIGVHTILSLVAVLRERENTIARVRDIVDADGFEYTNFVPRLRAALDPQETP
mgnify:FL=1